MLFHQFQQIAARTRPVQQEVFSSMMKNDRTFMAASNWHMIENSSSPVFVEVHEMPLPPEPCATSSRSCIRWGSQLRE